MGCSSPEEASGCCLDAHGRGVDGSALEQLLAECSGQACDPEQYISAATALCLAQANGLASGVGWCGAGLVYNGESDVQWLVRNTTEDGCAAGEAFAEGDSIALDARDGSLLGTGTISGVVECPPTE
jgi:hypothetical protein